MAKIRKFEQKVYTAEELAEIQKHREEIRQDMLDQLKENGTNNKCLVDMVEHYMTLWDTATKLSEDISTRGVTVISESNAGVKNFKKNESVDQLPKINTQMLRILQALKIEAKDRQQTETTEYDEL